MNDLLLTRLDEVEIPTNDLWNKCKHRISVIILAFMKYYGGRIENYPKWLLNSPTMSLLPRYIHNLNQVINSDKQFVYTNNADFNPEIYIWIIENTEGFWGNIGYNIWWFELKKDKIYFKLTWE